MTPLAHAGGWDEILFLVLPAAVFFVVLQLRRKHFADQDGTADDATEEPSRR